MLQKPYVFIVQRLRDGKKVVAKINNNLGEKHILEFLHARDPPSERIIPLLGTLSSNLGPGILLSLRWPIQALVEKPGEYRGCFIQFAKDLIEGLAFIHHHGVAHRDIKPENLVYCDALRLQIIDFDIAVQVEGDDDLLDEDVGTDGYKAPEAMLQYGEIMPYNPLRADRWSCGRVIIIFLRCAGREHRGLQGFANKLMDDRPAAFIG